MSRRLTPAGWSRPERLARIAPLPFVATATILVALIVFTPVLISAGPSPLLAQGELAVDGVPGTNWTKFYVLPLDPQAIRYASVQLDLGSGFAWTGTCPAPASVPTWMNASDSNSIVFSRNSSASPLLVYASATYQETTGPVIYAGEFAFGIVNPGGPNPQLLLVPCTSVTPGVTVPAPAIALSDLPVFLALVDYGSGGPP